MRRVSAVEAGAAGRGSRAASRLRPHGRSGLAASAAGQPVGRCGAGRQRRQPATRAGSVRRCGCGAAAPRPGRPPARRLLLTLGAATSSSAHRVADPVAQQRGAGVAGLLGVELGGRQRAVLDGGHEPVAAVLGPGHQRVRGSGRWSPASSRGRRRSARSRTARPRRRRTAAVPAGASTVFQPMCGTDRRLQPLDRRPATRRSPRSRRRARRRARTGSACPRRCRAPAGRRRAAGR